jgi:hypothetical protein
MEVMQVLEAAMVILFGISWPLNIIKSVRSRTAKGKSLPFLVFILAGYICGVLSKIIGHSITYVFVFYVLNLVMVGIDFALYFRNRRLDVRAEKEALTP